MGNNKELNDRLYCAFLFSFGITKGCYIPMPSMVSKLILAIGVICWLYKVIHTQYSKKDKIIGAVIILIGIISAVMTQRLGILVAGAVMLGAKGIEFRKICKVFLSVQLIALIPYIVPELIRVSNGQGWSGIVQTRKILGVFGNAEQFRMSLGCDHPNSLQRAVFIITALIAYINLKRMKGSHLFMLFAVNIIFYCMTYSNTALALAIFYFAAIYCIKREFAFVKRISKYVYVLFLLSVLITIVMSAAYNPDNWVAELFNRLTTGRIKWSHEYMQAVPLSMWGRDTWSADVAYEWLDCGYVYVLLRYGVVTLTLYTIGVVVLLKRLWKNGYFTELYFVLCLQLYFVMENFMMIALQNYTWALLGMLMYGMFDKKNGEKNENIIHYDILSM